MFKSEFSKNILIKFITYYIRLVFFLSRKRLNFSANLIAKLKQDKSIILCSWHQNIMMLPFTINYFSKHNKNYQYSGLASKHKDGKMVAKFIGNFGIKTISGSSRNKANIDRGINVSSFRDIFKILKQKQQCFAITPDGPRGPAKKISGHVVNISHISKCPIVCFSYNASKKITLDTWDKFIIPLPFSTIDLYFSEPIELDFKKSNELNNELLEKILSKVV